jgi:hypothetical protein
LSNRCCSAVYWRATISERGLARAQTGFFAAAAGLIRAALAARGAVAGGCALSGSYGFRGAAAQKLRQALRIQHHHHGIARVRNLEGKLNQQ